MIDFTPRIDYSKPNRTVKVLNAIFSLSEHDILEAMKHDTIFIDNVEYECPKDQLRDCITNCFSGKISLELTEVQS